MDPELSRNYFELFGLEVGFEFDEEILALRYRDLQRAVHPDRFVNASDQERRLSVQQASRINDGFQTLRTPLTRAKYLLEVLGIPLDDTDTAMDPGFLMEQMELREALASVRNSDDPFATLSAVRDDLEQRERALTETLRAAFADGGAEALQRARDTTRKMQFMQKLLDEATELEEELVHGL